MRRINNPIEPHSVENIAQCGALPPTGETINLSDMQAVWITDETAEIIE